MIWIFGVTLLLLFSTARLDDLQYQSISFKGPKNAILKEKLVFSIPDGQCSGDVDKSLLCNNQKPTAVTLEVLDSRPYPLIHLGMFEQVQVQRVPDEDGMCPGRARVIVRLDCRVPLSF